MRKSKVLGLANQFQDHALIMMVDDEPLEMEVIQLYLQDHGYKNFLAVSEPRDAVSIIIESKPSLVLLDIVMPDISGLELLEDIRDCAELENIPIIVLTSSGDPAIKREALDLGANDILAKPLDASEVVLRINNTLAANEYYSDSGASGVSVALFASAANDSDASELNENNDSKGTAVAGSKDNE